MSRSTVRTAFVALAASSALVLAACGDDSDDNGAGSENGSTEDVQGDLIQDGTLVVAMSGEFQPFSYFDGNTLTGFDHDIGAAVAEELGLEMQGEAATFALTFGAVGCKRWWLRQSSALITEPLA